MGNILRERRLRWPSSHMWCECITASVVLGGSRIQERTRSTKSELEGRSQ